MTTHLTALSSPPAAPRAGDHVLGFAIAALATVVGAILTPFLALAWVALQPVLPLVLALRGRVPSDAEGTHAASGRAAA
jgi:hypothetical protein